MAVGSVSNVDQLRGALREGGAAMPGADLLLTNSYEALVADVQEAKYMGRGMIDGVNASTWHSATSIRTGSCGWKSASNRFRASWSSQARR